MRTALTIAGSDCSGGAGIQADLKTMMANGVYAMSVITALTAQNTMGVSGIMEVTPEFLKKQLDAVFTDIKTGCCENRHGGFCGINSCDCGTVVFLQAKVYCGRPGYGFDQRFKAD